MPSRATTTDVRLRRSGGPPAFDCTGTGCAFGPPMPFSNGPESQCLQLVHTAAASGAVQLASGETSLDLALEGRLVINGDAGQPCPICYRGPKNGLACMDDADCAGTTCAVAVLGGAIPFALASTSARRIS